MNPSPKDLKSIYFELCDNLISAVKKRVIGTTDRPVACLLSGGLDSSLIAALVSKFYPGKLETYSIGMEGSEDLKYAEIVAEHIESKHTSIIVSQEEFLDAIPEVIRAIESYDTTSVRASVGNYLIGKYIAKHSTAKVIFNGDGSYELAGGYLYFHAAPNNIEFDRECKRLLADIHAFDVLRSDKCISSHGLEPRTPFLDRGWVDYYLSIPIDIRKPKPGQMEKNLIRTAFSTFEPGLLPQSVLWRKKEAFSDGVSSQHKSWYQIIGEHMETLNIKEIIKENNNYNNINIPKTKEQIYYRAIYDEAYPDTAAIVPYFWMPRFIESNDPSARTLKIYKIKTI
jgi:asparagine synthase (glutamine-hydrolysing)